MRISVEQDTEALQMQVMKICDYEAPHKVYFQDGSWKLLSPERANRVMDLNAAQKPEVRYTKFRLASLSVVVFNKLFEDALK